MDKKNKPIVKEEITDSICEECGAEFKSRIYTCLGFTIQEHYCKTCTNKFLTDEQKKEDTAKKAEIISQRRRWRLNSGIDSRYMYQDFSTFDKTRPGNVKEIYDKCFDYAENFPIEYDLFLRSQTKDKKAKPHPKAYPSLLLFSLNWGNGKLILSQQLHIESLIGGMVRMLPIQYA